MKLLNSTGPGGRRVLLASLPVAALLAFGGAAGARAQSVFETDLPAPAGVALTRLADSAHMEAVLTLPLRDAAGAAQFVADVSNPDSARFGHYLTPAEFGARFGASQAAYEFVRSWADANGFTVSPRNAARTTITIAGTAGLFGRVFSTEFASFDTQGHGLGRAFLRTPRLPAALSGSVQSIVGLASRAQYAPLFHVVPAAARTAVGTGLGGGYAPSDIRTAYDIPAQTGASSETVALFEQGGYEPSDISIYDTQYGVSVPVSPIGVNGSSTAPAGSDVEVEAALDIDAVGGVNPATKQILVYIDTASSFSAALVAALTQIADDRTATVVSISYGLDEKSQGENAVTAENTVLTQLAAQGQTVFVSAGDGGASGSQILGIIALRAGKNVEDPGSQPLVTSVGGTTLNTSSNESWASEYTWNEWSKQAGATGGGISAYWGIPAYQIKKGVSVAVANGGSPTQRNVPDLAADADPYTGYSIYSAYEGGWLAIGGTSLSSPLWAGMTSVINADRVAKKLPRVGYLNTQLYAVSPLASFHDIVAGNNSTTTVTGYAAGAGYDDVTGWGSVDLGKLLPVVTK
jgi:subtilase family serine protease